MTVLNNIQKTINDIFDLYRNASKKFYGLSLSGGILASLFSVIISVIICTIMLKFIDTDSLGFEPENIFEHFLYNPFIMERFNNISLSLLILFMGVYGIYILQEEKNGFKEKYSLNDFLSGIEKKTWNHFFFYFAILVIINLILFQDLFNTSSLNSGFIDTLNLNGAYDQNSLKTRFLQWVNSIISLVKIYIPYFLAMLLIMKNYGLKIDLKSLKQYKPAILSSLILCFCIDTIAYTIIDYVNFYIITLINIPFENSIFPSVIFLFLKLAIGVFFYLGFATTIAYPFKQIKESLYKEV